ncbi:stromal interaction molecule homolog isoform X2 [Anopheles merus]|uniref:stromal interaction molecule homolog isoform X2 n=1 Tax=Anopheles merus TaxID=30066 RepID=UPI001BE4715F|nr:stromal interaction molecule homolog isoform X2 [Anopheles merus]
MCVCVCVCVYLLVLSRTLGFSISLSLLRLLFSFSFLFPSTPHSQHGAEDHLHNLESIYSTPPWHTISRLHRAQASHTYTHTHTHTRNQKHPRACVGRKFRCPQADAVLFCFRHRPPTRRQNHLRVFGSGFGARAPSPLHFSNGATRGRAVQKSENETVLCKGSRDDILQQLEMRYFTRNFNAFACCCSLLLLPLGGLADVERGAPEAPAKAPIHQHQQHHPHQQPQSVKLHQPAVPPSAAYHQPSPATGAAQHPDGPAPQQPVHYHQQAAPAAAATSASPDRSLSRQPPSSLAATSAPPRPLETRNSYTVLSQAMSQAVHHEFGTYGSGAMAGDAGSVCTIDDIDCLAHHDQLGMEAIRSLHRQLDDDDNGDIDLSESDDFLREELKYDSGYEKRHKAFHFNDDMHISVKELWEAWLRSEVHNWTVDQTTEWLAQSVQLPQYVHLFRLHKVTGKVLPRLAVNNMHYVSNVLGIKDPIHKQKIALKAMDAVLFGPPRETGTRWKDLLLVTLLLTAIIGSWYAYHQNKSAKIHIRRMAKDVEGLLKAEVALKEMQKELEQARIEQENVGKEKMDLERRLREAPTLSSSSSDLELQQLKQEIEVLRSELNRAEVEIHDHCWTPPQGLQSWLQLTYELENKHHIRKRIMAEKQLEQAREACEKLRKKRSSLVGAFVSTHGKSIDDVDRSIVEARNALNDVTNDLQERMHRWKQIETMLGFGIVNNSGIAHLENLLYNRNGVAGKTYRSRLSSSQDDLDDDSVQGKPISFDNFSMFSSE